MVKDPNVWVRLLAECVAELFGTLILVLFGCSGIAQYTLSRATLSGFLSVNFAFGFGAMIAVYVAGPISGSYFEEGSSTMHVFPSIRCASQSGCIDCDDESTIDYTAPMSHLHHCAYDSKVLMHMWSPMF